MKPGADPAGPLAMTSIDKALDVCEALSLTPAGASLTDVARAVSLPRPSVHRLLGVLKRRGYVRQDDESQRYSLTVKMLDLSFRLLGRSELRLHAYPVLRDFVVRSRPRCFVAVPASGEVTYVWGAGPDEAAMRTAYGRAMPAHCSEYVDDATPGSRRLSCLRLSGGASEGSGAAGLLRIGPPDGEGSQRLSCTCAPVYDYTGREVARIGVFGHGPDDRALLAGGQREVRDLAGRVSTRLGFLPQAGTGYH